MGDDRSMAPPSRDDVDAFLRERYGTRVDELDALDGGFWSSAYAYRVGGRALVLRLGPVSEGFEMDRAAMAFSGPDLPVPPVLEIGEAMGRAYAISERRYGRFLETVAGEAERARPAVLRLLASLRAVPSDPEAPAAWYSPGEPGRSTWRSWLTAGLIDDPAARVSGWRALLADEADLDRLFRACEQRVTHLVEACPERRDLVHGDLLHGNVLLAEDASRVTAVFSWKCSVRGDFLFDTAWCTFWEAWHPGIAAIGVWEATVSDPSLRGGDALVDAAVRHHCYELQIGASHLGWHAWTGQRDSLRAVAERTAMILERGPREGPAP